MTRKICSEHKLCEVIARTEWEQDDGVIVLAHLRCIQCGTLFCKDAHLLDSKLSEELVRLEQSQSRRLA
jgi:hypothetical protein